MRTGQSTICKVIHFAYYASLGFKLFLTVICTTVPAFVCRPTVGVAEFTAETAGRQHYNESICDWPAPSTCNSSGRHLVEHCYVHAQKRFQGLWQELQRHFTFACEWVQVIRHFSKWKHSEMPPLTFPSKSLVFLETSDCMQPTPLPRSEIK